MLRLCLQRDPTRDAACRVSTHHFCAHYCPANTKCPRRFCCQHCSPDSVQNGFSLPKLVVVTRFAATPAATSACLVDCARLSPSAMLYSVDPRSSQCPSTRILQFGCWVMNCASACSAALSCGRTS